MNDGRYEINELYKPLYTSDKRYFLVTGGRGSLKSHSVHDYVVRLTYESGQGIFFTRMTMVSAETSIIPEFEAAIDRLGVREHFTITKRDIVNNITGSYIWFRGLKSSSGSITANQKSLSGITTWIVEEAEDLQDESLFDKVDDSIRTAGKQNRVILVMNPTTPEHWIYDRWFKHSLGQQEVDGFNVTVSSHPKLKHIHTTYLIGRKYLQQDWLDKAEKVRQIAKEGFDIELQRRVTEEEQESAKVFYINNYLGGWRERKEGVIFTNWSLGEFPVHLPVLYGQDFGYEDPTTLVRVAVDKRARKIYVKEELYKSGLKFDTIYDLNKKITKGKLIIADSAEKTMIKSFANRGLNIKRCKKGQGSVLAGIKMLGNFEIIVSPDSYNIVRELNNYIWLDRRSDTPIDDFNHCLDPIRYVVTELMLGTRKPTMRNG